MMDLGLFNHICLHDDSRRSSLIRNNNNSTDSFTASLENGNKIKGRNFPKSSRSKIVLLFVVAMLCFFMQNTLITKNGKEINGLQLRNRFSRSLGESTLRGSADANHSSTNVDTKKKNYFQNRDKNYDKVVHELEEKFRNEKQHNAVHDE